MPLEEMDASKIGAELAALEGDPYLDVLTNLPAREEALYLLAFLEDLVQRQGPDAAALQARIDALRERFERANEQLFAEWWALLADGAAGAPEIRRRLNPYTAYRPDAVGYRHTRYEPIDVLVGGVLGLDEAPEETVAREPEMIYLEFTPTSVALEMVDRVPMGPEDVFVDLGAGLGQVPILVHLLTGVRARGVELQPGYAAQARRIAAELDLTGVTFDNADARRADLTEGTAFYLFTPFVGDVLQSVLDRVHEAAARHPVLVCSYGASTLQVARQPWLRSVDGNAREEFRLAVFSSA